MSDCLPCRNNAIKPALLPLRECVFNDGLWRVAHAFNSALSGWMVVVTRRHVTSLSELTAAEAAAFGPLLRRLSAALEEVLGAAKAYVIFLAEAVTHVHIHVIPRRVDLPPDRKGPHIFAYLMHPEAEWVSTDEMDRIASEVRRLLEHSRA